jgi:hypothetical protein
MASTRRRSTTLNSAVFLGVESEMRGWSRDCGLPALSAQSRHLFGEFFSLHIL